MFSQMLSTVPKSRNTLLLISLDLSLIIINVNLTNSQKVILKFGNAQKLLSFVHAKSILAVTLIVLVDL